MTFSADCHTMRTVWDATCLASFMKDPLSYYWTYVEGWRPREHRIPLIWGTAWDKAMARYWHYRVVKDRRAVEKTVRFAIEHAKAVNLDSIAADSKDAQKRNLATLIRSIVWYDDLFGDCHLFTPAVAQQTLVRMELPIKTPAGESYWLVGNFDQVVREVDSGKLLVLERKTTTQTIGRYFWLQYDPSVQLNTYDLLAHDKWDTQGVWVEACQTAAGFSRFEHHRIYRTKHQRENWLQTVCYWIKQAENLATTDNWWCACNPATQIYDSVLRNIERRTPTLWKGLLQVEMVKSEVWNPLEIQ